MGHLVLLRNNNRRLNVELNAMNTLISENEKTFSDCIRVIARTYIPIDIMIWRAVSKKLKNKIWGSFGKQIENSLLVFTLLQLFFYKCINIFVTYCRASSFWKSMLSVTY